MSHSNISIFVPHKGCPNKCSFCNQNSITGSQKAPTAIEVKATCQKAFSEIYDRENTEIAFFGGSFTAIDREYMLELLECVQEFIGDGKFKGIRVSTRPDCINIEVLSLLKQYNVTSIELGVQSMNDMVLLINDRGHSSQDVKNAVSLIRQFDFELGLQMMVGLYKSTPEFDIFTAEEIIKLSPETVRIYPVVILKNTKLATLFQTGEYIPYTLEKAVSISAQLIEMFEENDIKIIKLGLHASEMVESDLLGGIYHPAFKELCYNQIYLKKLIEISKNVKDKSFAIEVPARRISQVIGQKKSNIIAMKKLGFDIKAIPSQDIDEREIKIIEEGTVCT